MNVLITGGATGIGLATTEYFLARGATVAVGYLEDGHRPAAGNILAIQCDIRSDEAVATMVDKVLRDFGSIDVLVNCASRTGMSAVASFLHCTPRQMADIVDTNLNGTIRVSQAVARAMVQAGSGGSIIHVASVGALAAQERASIYCATKAAQVALAKGMALELAPHNIRVNCVSPGDIQTDTSQIITEAHQSPDTTWGQYARKTPLGRRGRPEEIAAAIYWLASPEASFVTGTNLLVDGGFLTY